MEVIAYFFNAIYQTFCNTHEVLPNLWIGNSLGAHDKNFIQKKNISVIVNCTPDIPFINEVQQLDSSFTTYRVPVYDSMLEKDFILMEQYLKLILPILYKSYVEEKKHVFIGCYAGKQRSGIVLAAFLKVLLDKQPEMYSFISTTLDKNQQFNDIVRFMLTKRPQVFTYGWKINFKKTYDRFFNLA